MSEPIYDVLALFSGGLDSILAVKVLEMQGLRVKSLHFFTPFFGKPAARKYWTRKFGLDLALIDCGEAFIRMMQAGPSTGYGKVLNPCVDCKILLLREAKTLLPKYGATFLATGEVLGQRPMSQRRDTLNRISREADVRDCLLRPLSALHLPPTPMEEDGRVNRDLLCGIWGRGRNDQFELAHKFGLEDADIPTPGGGCRLAEKENARRYWPVLKYLPEAGAADFYLANLGRQFWDGLHWLCIGRNQADNEALQNLAKDTDFLFKTVDFPGPVGLARPVPGADWSEDRLLSAAAFVAAYSPKAKQYAGPLRVRITNRENSREVILPQGPAPAWPDLTWDDVRPEIHALRKPSAKAQQQAHQQGNGSAQTATQPESDNQPQA